MNRLVAAFLSTARRHPDRIAIRSRADDVSVSFAELASESEAWARRFAELPPGAVALSPGRRIDLVPWVLGTWRADRAAIPIDSSLGPDERASLAASLGAHSLVAGEVGEVRALPTPRPAVLPPSAALVKVTSGSTGEPTGAVLGADSLLAGIEQIRDAMSIGGDDVVCAPIPLTHSYGFDSGVLSLAVLGTSLVVESALYPASLLGALVDSQATVLLLVPPLVRALAGLRWPEGHRLRLAVSAGGPLEANQALAFRETAGIAVHQFYGSTETGGISFETDPLDPRALGTVGFPLPGVEISFGDDGRVAVTSRANAGALVTRSGLCPLDGPVAIGDTAELTPEGRLRLTGRVAGLLNVGGRRMQAAGLERALCGLAGVRDAAVVGIPAGVRGDRIVAFVVTDGRRLTIEEMPRGIRPREVRYLEALPYTDRGKLDRRRLLQLAETKQ